MAELNNNNEIQQHPESNGFHDNGDIQRIASNDPYVNHLHICRTCCFPGKISHWRQLGYLIGNNTYIKGLYIIESLTKKRAEALCNGLVTNRSISGLTIGGCNLQRGELLRHLIPFIQNNNNLRSFTLFDCRLRSFEIHDLANALSKATQNLKRVDLSCLRIPQNLYPRLIHSLAVCPQVQELDLAYNRIGYNGCISLVELLNDFQMKIRHLDLEGIDIDDDGMIVLSDAFARDQDLETLNLSRNCSLSSDGWNALSSALSSERSRLRELSAICCSLDDVGIIEFARGIAGNKNLVKLELDQNYSITSFGWKAFFIALRSLNSTLKDISLGDVELNCEPVALIARFFVSSNLKKLDLSQNLIRDDGVIALAEALVDNKKLSTLSSNLKELNLSQNFIGDEGIIALAEALVGNKRLSTLILDQNIEISLTGWEALSVELPNSSLRNLSLAQCGIDGESIAALSHGFAHSSALETLDLHGNLSITSREWGVFATVVLESRISKLKQLFLEFTFLTDEDACYLAAGLANNNSLTLLDLGENYITQEGWKYFSGILCNKSSIEDTLHSNHTLNQLMKYDSEDGLPLDLLRLNRRKDKRAIAVHKVVMCHLSGDYNLHPFIHMDLPLLIYVVGRISKRLSGDSRSESDIVSSLYRLLKAVPSLLLFASNRDDDESMEN